MEYINAIANSDVSMVYSKDDTVLNVLNAFFVDRVNYERRRVMHVYQNDFYSAQIRNY